jgi:hypothetical protein
LNLGGIALSGSTAGDNLLGSESCERHGEISVRL